MILTIIVALNINFADLKEFIYEHKRYNIEENFNNTKIKLNSPKTIEYDFNLGSIKKQKNNTLETSFKGKLIFNENLINFKNLEHNNKINDKIFKNKKVKKLEKKEFKVNFHKGFISLKDKILYFDFFVKNLFFWRINKIPESLIVGQVWSEDNKKIIDINKTKYQLSEYNYMKFLGYRNGFKLIKITYLFNLKNFLSLKTKYFGAGEVLLEIKDGYIYKTSINMKVMNDTITENIKFNKTITTVKM